MKLIVLGAPGAGKGTQAHFVSLHYGIPHISTGELLRTEIKKGSGISAGITELMKSGKLVPDEIAIKLLCERLSACDCKNGFLLDGFPRTLAQAMETEHIAGKVDKVISVHVEDSVIIERMSGRRICRDCGATYHLVYKPPIEKNLCDICKEKLVQRNDDKASTVRHRLEIYHNEAEPINDYFRKRNELVVVDGAIDIAEITAAIIEAIDNCGGVCG